MNQNSIYSIIGHANSFPFSSHVKQYVLASFVDEEEAKTYMALAQREWDRLAQLQQDGKRFYNLGTDKDPYINAYDPKAGITKSQYTLAESPLNPPLPNITHPIEETDD